MKSVKDFFRCSNCHNCYSAEYMNEVEIGFYKESKTYTEKEYWCDHCILKARSGEATIKVMKNMVKEENSEEPNGKKAKKQ